MLALVVSDRRQLQQSHNNYDHDGVSELNMRLPKNIVTNKTNDTNIDAYLSILWTINTGTTTALTYDTVLP